MAHIVARENDADADTLVTTAYIEGTPLEALCGQVFVPIRDPKSLPPCERCLEVVTEILRMRELLEKMISDHSGKSIEEVSRDIERDKILTAAQAVEYGLIDSVLESLKTPALA